MSATARMVLAFVCVFGFAATGFADDHPLSQSRRAELDSGFQKTIDRMTESVRADANDVDSYSRRGDAYFFRADFVKAVADYEKMVELNPSLDTGHWRRGIARFYAGAYEKAAHQFEIYHTFDNVDRENGIWRFLSQTKAYGLPRARKGLLQYEKDDREPFPAVYQLFAGSMTSGQVLEQIASARIDADEREKRLFYAHLYIGLNDAVQEKTASAVKHLRNATANRWAPKAGFGPRYMWHVGRVHYEQLVKKAKQPR